MSLWGMKDSKTVAATSIAIATNGTVTGVDTSFDTELAVGDFIFVDSKHFVVTAVASATAATVDVADGAASVAAVSATGTFVVSEKPLYVKYASGESVAEIYGADSTEAGVTSGLAHAGWVKRTVKSRGGSNHTTFETLVAAGSITGDAEDTILPDS